MCAPRSRAASSLVPRSQMRVHVAGLQRSKMKAYNDHDEAAKQASARPRRRAHLVAAINAVRALRKMSTSTLRVGPSRSEESPTSSFRR